MEGSKAAPVLHVDVSTTETEQGQALAESLPGRLVEGRVAVLGGGHWTGGY